MQVYDTLECIVRTNREWIGKCSVNLDETTITIVDVFSSETANFYSSVTIELRDVTNPLHNKDQGLGFSIFTYTDSQQTYRIDYLPNNKMVPILKCTYPCRECLENDKENCQSCWTESFSDYKYFFFNEDEAKGECKLSCPAGYTRNGDDSYVCVKCDSSCATCLDSDKFSCIQCHPDFPYKVSGTGKCLESCKRGYY